jgi:hypothetical protein
MTNSGGLFTQVLSLFQRSDFARHEGVGSEPDLTHSLMAQAAVR